MPDAPLWKDGPFRAVDAGLLVSGTPTFEQWERAIYNLCRVRSVSSWTLGDLINAGREKWESDGRYDTVLQATNLKYQTLANHAWVARRFDANFRRQHPYLVKVPFAWARELVPLTDEDIVTTLRRAEGEHWDYEIFHAHIRGERRTRAEQERNFPDGTFGLIYADPPWQYDAQTAPPNRQIENQYRTMTLAEIQELKDPAGRAVQSVMADSCIVYMWATNPKMEEALSVMRAWGVTYKTNMVWVKDIMGMGYWARQRHELLLIGVKGNPLTPREDLRPDSVISAPRREHSQKPDDVYDMLELLYAGVPKLELFQRIPRPAWTGWGLEMVDGGGPRGLRLGDHVLGSDAPVTPEEILTGLGAEIVEGV